jgi:uncharacterized protein
MQQILPIAKTLDNRELYLLPSKVNRHGLITGATGTGKTVTLKVLLEQLSSIGVPVFAPDLKGDLCGIAAEGDLHFPPIKDRIQLMNLENFKVESFPVQIFDLTGKKGTSLRTTLVEIGPVLLARILELNETQSGILQIIFKISDEQGLLLVDINDLDDLVSWIADNVDILKETYGNIPTQSILSIKRKLVVLKEMGGDIFFGEPALSLTDLIKKTADGKGVITILDSTEAINSPRIYSTFLLWLLSELFEELPEVGDIDVPKLVLFFDEAHYLFSEASDELIQRIETVVRLIRSKGVGVFFITQNVDDIPPKVLQQLGNKIQHGLRAFTQKDQRILKATAESFRINPEIKIEETLTTLKVGEALISFLDKDGVPSIVEHAKILPPRSSIKPLSESDRSTLIETSEIHRKYKTAVNRESASELLASRKNIVVQSKEDNEEDKSSLSSKAQSIAGTLGKSIFRQLVSKFTSAVTREITRGILGSMKGRR